MEDTVRRRWAQEKFCTFVMPLERANLISMTQVVKKRKSQNRVAFGVKRGGKRVPKIDCSNTTRLCIFNAQSSFSSWEKHQFIFPLSPSFHLSVSPLFPGNRPVCVCVCVCVWCALFVHRNINHSVCLVCISESFYYSLLPKNNCRSTAAGIYRQ